MIWICPFSTLDGSLRSPSSHIAFSLHFLFSIKIPLGSFNSNLTARSLHFARPKFLTCYSTLACFDSIHMGTSMSHPTRTSLNCDVIWNFLTAFQVHSLLSFPKNFTTGAFVYTSKKQKTIATQLSIKLYKRFALLSQIFANLKRGEFSY